jgi:hypothetical protein
MFVGESAFIPDFEMCVNESNSIRLHLIIAETNTV